MTPPLSSRQIDAVDAVDAVIETAVRIGHDGAAAQDADRLQLERRRLALIAWMIADAASRPPRVPPFPNMRRR